MHGIRVKILECVCVNDAVMAPFGTVVLTPYPYNVAELAVQCQIKICVQCIFQAKSCQREAIP